MNVRIIVTHPIPLEVVELLSGISEVILGKFSENCRGEMLQRVSGAHAVIVSGRDVAIDDALISRCPSLRIVAATFKGPDNIDIDACTRNGVWVTTVPDAPCPSSFIPDATLGAALEAAANILETLIGVAPKGAVNIPLPGRRRRAAHL
jgi:lactate dehydrogenase-like 2-hydroxyacid dehydrogenase